MTHCASQAVVIELEPLRETFPRRLAGEAEIKGESISQNFYYIDIDFCKVYIIIHSEVDKVK